MANTYTIAHSTVVGDMRCQLAALTLTDGPTETIATGLDYLYGATVTVQTAATAHNPGLVINGTAGSFQLQSGTSGSVYQVVIFGR